MNEPTSLASWTRALRKQLDALGLDSAALCKQAGLDPQLMDDPNARYPLSATSRLWALAVQVSGDPAIGLRVSRFVSPTTFHALGYALVASGSLREVFERIVRYHPVVSDALKLELSREGERYRFRLLQPPGSPAPALEAIDAFAAIYVRTCRNRLGRDYAPLAVYLRRPEPVDPTPWHTVFRAPLFFGAEEDRLEFAARDFDSHLDDANPELAEHNETVLKRTLAQLQPLTWERKVRAAIEAQLPDGEPSAERIAQALHLSVRSLQRHLADEGCRFDALLNDCRQNLALQHLRDPQCSLAEVSHLLGFADTSSFNRAFKRWTGMTPGQFREGLR
ncbi:MULTISPECIES: AraC family transcriptional regulator [Pseudomonas]|jgi:AraC-like DNA-binding protein|uniref:AraC family transcriptional regulator n=1 Tax=Pseudomonas extremaustralis TaxID=359110 RepID=A0A5C5Q7T3_9PSED|nr:AraC family transcriptional regulator [Pseudomonas extremaustralis]EZI27616.1 AraC family transcriptional regulator [Pseudomonas extremaustralis 14-3 substr. 14-3b]MDF3134904.1 AraC family transcriptional regulator [Pseudomonas extremaustralis]TWS01813.1 AraC family transcriptional regulator [Pseudomonas extremaustralis]SDF93902.1 transcriptional regulator, AraC family [Pseudomonas extremaustralis]SKB07445.1 transcriptional regulator, AraC family [Pseudomonas extremaustralis]